MAELKPGQRVTFSRLHDKATKLTGTIVKEVEGLLHIKTDAANGSVSRIEEAHPSDVTVMEEEKPKQASAGTKSAKDSPKE